MTIITEEQFKIRLKEKLLNCEAKCVTGPGRSGAMVSVYVSYYLKIPFIPYGQRIPEKLYPVLLIDTAEQSGRTIKKAIKEHKNCEIMVITLFKEPPRVHFWFEF